jgi:hypothetical protein
LVLLFSNSYTTLFWEFYFLPFSVNVQTNIIDVSLLSLLQRNLTVIEQYTTNILYKVFCRSLFVIP